jgi:hypothetical protein
LVTGVLVFVPGVLVFVPGVFELLRFATTSR